MNDDAQAQTFSFNSVTILDFQSLFLKEEILNKLCKYNAFISLI